MLANFFIPFLIIAAFQAAVIHNAEAQFIVENDTSSIGLAADLRTTLIDKSGKESVSEARIYRLGRRVRYEPKGDNRTEISIYDFDLLKDLRIVGQDKVFFERRISRSFLIKAERDGLYMPVNPNVTVDKIRLKEDRFDNHPAIVYLAVRSLKGKDKIIARDYSMVWEATDLGNLPVKIVYPLPDYTTVIVEYRNAILERFDPLLFQPPPDFLNLSPF